MMLPTYIHQLQKIPQLGKQEIINLQTVVDRLVFRTNKYYLSSTNWDDPDDSIPASKAVSTIDGEL